MSYYITIDTGTTNTRISLMENEKIVDSIKKHIGAGDTRKSPKILHETLKTGISEILKHNEKKENDIECVLACGMITSELGICCIEHLSAPCGIKELAKGMYKEYFPEICQLPFFFIRGVKTSGDNSLKTDVMRGEETELFGIEENISQNCLYVLPGSHSKLIFTDFEGKISKFSTQMTGELMSAVAKATILSQNIKIEEDVDVDYSYLEKGYLYTKEKGINEALFKVRVLNNFCNATNSQLYGFFKGAVLQGEIDRIIKSEAKKIVIAGKKQLREPMCHLLNRYSRKEIIGIGDNISNNATAFGMVRIYSNR